MQIKTTQHAFSVVPMPGTAPIQFEITEYQGDFGTTYSVAPHDQHIDSFIAAARRGYSTLEIKDYYLVQGGFKSVQRAIQSIVDFFNDLTGCARSVPV